MKLLQWFKDKIGNKVVAIHPKEGDGSVYVADEAHATHLYNMQEHYRFEHHDEEDENIIPTLTGVLITDVFTNNSDDINSSLTWSNSSDCSPSSDTSSSFDFGGGQTDGGGAGGDW